MNWTGRSAPSAAALGVRDMLRTRLTRRGLTLGAGPVSAVSLPGTASAALPTALMDATVTAALSSAAAGVLSRAAMLLLQAVLRNMAIVQFVRLAVPLVLIAVLVRGAAMVAYSGGTKLSGERTPIASSKLVPPPAPIDLTADPLPVGAVARLGSTRFLNAHVPTELAYAADGATLASFDGELHLWDPSTGREPRRIETGASRGSGFVQFAFAPDGQSVAVQGDFRTGLANLYDSKTGGEIRRFAGNGTANCLAFSPDGQVFAACLDNAGYPLITLWEVASGRVIRSMNSLPATLSLAFLFDGKVLISTAMESGAATTKPRGRTQQPHRSEESSIQFWEVASGTEIKRIRIANTRIKQSVVAAHGKTLATATTDKTIRLWDVATGRELRRFDGGGEPGHIAFSPDGLILASTERVDPPNFWEDTPLTTPIHVWDTATGRELGAGRLKTTVASASRPIARPWQPWETRL